MFKLSSKSVSGTSWKSSVTDGYSSVRWQLGKPNAPKCDKSPIGWVLEDEEGKVVSVYARTYLDGPEIVLAWQARWNEDWQIGAHSEETALRFKEWYLSLSPKKSWVSRLKTFFLGTVR